MVKVSVAAVALLLATSAQGQSAPDVAGARKAVDHYLAGHATGDPAEFRAAFHDKAMLYWMRDGVLAERTSADYVAGSSGKPAADEAQRRRRIESLDVTGSAGVAKVVLDYPAATLVDYLSLLKVGTEWKIVNKIFNVDPKPQKLAPTQR